VADANSGGQSYESHNTTDKDNLSKTDQFSNERLSDHNASDDHASASEKPGHNRNGSEDHDTTHDADEHPSQTELVVRVEN